MHKSVK